MNCDSTQVCIILYVFDVQIVFLEKKLPFASSHSRHLF